MKHSISWHDFQRSAAVLTHALATQQALFPHDGNFKPPFHDGSASESSRCPRVSTESAAACWNRGARLRRTVAWSARPGAKPRVCVCDIAIRCIRLVFAGLSLPVAPFCLIGGAAHFMVLAPSPRSSSGQDAALSRLKQEFDSPTGRQ